ncbi:transmembrane protein 186 isoform X1 [Callorhinchus milii]|nr:transmembrane protein 186 isoform X1 [Callorhinchus milii]
MAAAGGRCEALPVPIRSPSKRQRIDLYMWAAAIKNTPSFSKLTLHSRCPSCFCVGKTQRKAVTVSWLRSCSLLRFEKTVEFPGNLMREHAAKRLHTQYRHLFPASQKHPTHPNLQFTDNELFIMIYKFRGIRFLRAVSRLKLIQTGITVALLPTVYYFYLKGQLPYSMVNYTTGIASFAIVMLYSLSYYFRHFIGMMYLNESGTTLKVSHLTFWGKRNDFYIPVKDVLTLGDTGDATNETILQLRQYNSTEVFYFTVAFGQVVDEQKFIHVFGGIP